MRNIIYVKYSNERDDKFKIKTIISQDECNNYYVEKHALTESAKNHILLIEEHGKQLNHCAKNTKLRFSSSSAQGSVLSCEYVEGESLSSILVQKIHSKDTDGVLALVRDYCSELYKMATKPFSVTDSFEDVFGPVEFDSDMFCCSVTDIDMIFNNIIVCNDHWKVLDYEWTYTFPIPVKFVIYRAIMTAEASVRDFLLKNISMLNISEDELHQFDKMEAHFQKYVTGGEILMSDFQNLQKRIEITTLVNKEGLSDMQQQVNLQTTSAPVVSPCIDEYRCGHFYWDAGNGYQADQCIKDFPVMENGKSIFHIDLPAGCQKVRFDPVLNRSCVVSDLHITTNNGSCSYMPLNGVLINGVMAFANTNPQIEIPLSSNTFWIEITANIQICSGFEICEILSAIQKLPQLEQEKLHCLNQVASLNENLQHHVNLLETEKSKVFQLQEQLVILEAQHAEEQIIVCQNQIAAYEASLSEHAARIAEYEAHRVQQELHIQNLNMQLQDMSAHIHNLNIQHQQLSYQLNCMANSRSWKVTAPLRAMMRKIKNNRLGSLGYRFLKSLKHCGVRATSVKIINKLRQKRLLPQRSLRKAENISFHGFVECARSNGAQVLLPEVIEGYAKKKKQRKILFISHEMDLTGAPIVLRNFAMSVMNQGDLPIIASPRPGNLSKNVAENNVPVVVFDGVYSTDFVRRFAPLFDLIVVNTIVGSPVIDMMAETSTPVLWWIHEAEDSYYKEMLEHLPTIQPSNVSIYCVGSYAEKVLLSHRPNFRTEHLLYHTLDSVSTAQTESPIKKDDRILFVMVGTMQGRKGPDILADAILQMPEHLVHKSRFLFIGRPVDENVLQRMDAACKQYPNNVEYLGEMPNQKLLALYKDVDCLICPSRDDPMPCTITEVLLNSIPVICSENTGYAPILCKMGSGKVFNNNDPAELAKHLCSIVENPSSLKEMSELARQTYEDYFSQKVFEVNSQKAISDTLAMRQSSRKKSVSVVIPAYNAGEEGRKLFELLRNQENLDELDIIVVDSGSKDDTVEIARQYGCKVIQIPNEEFSHSYARNLGAQHAVTDYILFMTQDAVPINKDWISRMITALQENNAVAASCREIPRPECDLYGQVCGFVHNSFMEIIDHDRVMEKPNPWTFESSRKNGQLNDVACLVKRNVFERYQYRGNYAEDLDLGLRLISDNYRLMLMATTPVMHSHTRPAMYHFRRAIVDVAALKRIMPEQPVRETHADQAYNRILTAAVMTFHTLRVLTDRIHLPAAPAQLREMLWSIYAEAESAAKSINKDMVAVSIAQGLPYKEDGGMLKLMEEILTAAPCVAFDSTNFLDIGAFIVDQTLSYIEHLGLCISEKEILDICDTMIKRFGQIVGIVFAEYSMTDGRKDESLDLMIQKYSQGI